MIEAATHPQGALPHSGVFKARPKLATHKAAHAAVQTLRTEPGGLGGRGKGCRGRHVQTGWVESPQTRAFAHQKLCRSHMGVISNKQ